MMMTECIMPALQQFQTFIVASAFSRGNDHVPRYRVLVLLLALLIASYYSSYIHLSHEYENNVKDNRSGRHVIHRADDLESC